MQKEGIFPEGIVKYSPDWDKAMQEYGQRVKEDADFASRWGDAGPIYGKQWRRWEYYDHDKGMFVEIDQVGKMIEGLRKNPPGKSILSDSWNPGDTPKMSLPPCHVLYQATANEEGELELQLFRGVAINSWVFLSTLQVMLHLLM
jgi:thymidylate synthase